MKTTILTICTLACLNFSAFAEPQAMEVVSMELQGNGKWVVAGYHIALKNQIRIRPLEFLDHR
jgi:hypothetical protein